MNNSPSIPVPSPSGRTCVGNYVVLFKDGVTRDEVNALTLIDGFSFPDGKRSYDDNFDKLKIIIGAFLASVLTLFRSWPLP